MPKLNIRQKLMLLFVATSIIPLLVINIFWLRSQQNSLRVGASDQQILLAESAASKVDQFLTNAVNSMIIHAQTASVQQFDLPYAKQELAAFIKQDADIQRIALINSKGEERTAFNRDGILTKLENVANSDEFRVVTFLSGKEYITPVFYEKNTPHVKIAVPLVTLENSQKLSNLSTAESGVIRGRNDIKGALIADFNLKNLWQSVLSSKLGSEGYAFLVDDKGFLIAHPDQSFVQKNPNQSRNPEVARFLASNELTSSHPTVTLSERNIQVLSSHHRISRTGWAVIVQEPISSIYAGVDRISRVAILVFWVSGIIAILLGFLFSRQLSTPIRELAEGAERIGKGDLKYRFNFKRKDEVGLLGRTFNDMAANLSGLVRGVEAGRSKLDMVLNSIGEGVLAIDGNQTIIVSNITAARLVGGSPRQLIGQKLEDVYQWTKNGEPVRIDYSQLGSSYNQLQLVTQDGQIHYLDLIVARIEDDPSGIQAIITIHDETRNRELEVMKVDFVSMAAHELRTPLTVIRGYLGLLNDEGDEHLNEKQRRYLERTRISSDQLAGLINNLLNVARIERGVLNMHLNKLSWIELVKNNVHDQMFTAKQKEINITYNGPDSGVLVLGDEVALNEVVNNLVSNAIHYSPNGSSIVIKVQLLPKGILTSVADNGIGIPDKAREHLFTKFFRVHGGLAMGSGGTGLGLYISKSIVELHNGRIWVESELHKGSTFYFSLPYFDQKRYDESREQSQNLRKKHGWVTKNIAR